MQLPSSSLAVFVLAFYAILGLGCAPAPEIKTYSVVRTEPRSAPIPLDQVDHILVAILPQDEKAWFFKLSGKKPAIERQRTAFEKFLATVSVGNSADETPNWSLPEGWTERGKSEMRAATLLIPDPGGELELAVSSLPLAGEWEDFLVPNVNRWLRQLQCESLSRETILELGDEVATQRGKATVFQLAGIMPSQPRGMGGNPHAGLGIPAPKKAPPESKARADQARPSELSYSTPTGWLPGEMNMMRKAAFLLPGGGPSDGVTVTSFPAGGGQMSDVVANVQRWGRQVGLAGLTGAEVDELSSPVEVGGFDGTYVELSSPKESDRKVSLFVAMVERRGQVWFFKMLGETELVTGQRDAFRQFLASVKFK